MKDLFVYFWSVKTFWIPTISLSILLWFLDSVLLLKVVGTFLIVFTTLFVIYVEFKEIGKRNELFDVLTEIMDKNSKKSSD
ncbi:hypothetical protein ACYSNL_02025 [Enterococcus cecorum]